MPQKRKRLKISIVILLFIAYFIIAARPIPREIVLAPVWVSSLQVSNMPEANTEGDIRHTGQLVPFVLGNRFGYVDTLGQFAVNLSKTGDIYLADNLWTEYEAEPSTIDIKDTAARTVLSFDSLKGYPILLDNRIFLLGSDQNMLSEIDAAGNVIWSYEFGAPITCIDAAGGLLLTGSLDGIMEILDSKGRRVFFYEPGGSRYSVILGCAFSDDGSRLGIISGIEKQRFLLLERFGASNEYKVIYHEFLDDGFRRPVRISFIDDDRRIVFERFGGIGCYTLKTRQGIFIPLDGEIAAMDNSGDQGFFFLISSHSQYHKELIGIKFPQTRLLPFLSGRKNIRDTIFIKAFFTSEDVFLGRTGSSLIAGGKTTLISFELEEK